MGTGNSKSDKINEVIATAPIATAPIATAPTELEAHKSIETNDSDGTHNFGETNDSDETNDSSGFHDPNVNELTQIYESFETMSIKCNNINNGKHSGKICNKCDRLCFWDTCYCYSHNLIYDNAILEYHNKKVTCAQKKIVDNLLNKMQAINEKYDKD